jgi:hypothetical protein
MLYTKLALVTCAFYIGFSILLDMTGLVVATWKGGFVILFSKVGWVVFFACIWLVSFLLSYRIVLGPVFARIHNLRN